MKREGLSGPLPDSSSGPSLPGALVQPGDREQALQTSIDQKKAVLGGLKSEAALREQEKELDKSISEAYGALAPGSIPSGGFVAREPVITAAGITGLVVAVVGIFGLRLTGIQLDSLTQAVTILLPVILSLAGGLVARSRVAPAGKEA